MAIRQKVQTANCSKIELIAQRKFYFLAKGLNCTGLFYNEAFLF